MVVIQFWVLLIISKVDILKIIINSNNYICIFFMKKPLKYIAINYTFSEAYILEER